MHQERDPSSTCICASQYLPWASWSGEIFAQPWSESQALSQATESWSTGAVAFITATVMVAVAATAIVVVVSVAIVIVVEVGLLLLAWWPTG